MVDLPASPRLDLGLRLKDDGPAPGLVRRPDALRAHDDPVGGEVRPGQHLHDLVERAVGVLHPQEQRVAHLGKVVRRKVRRHAYRDALRAVADEVGEAAGQDGRLQERRGVVVDPIHRVAVEVVHDLHREGGEAALGVPLGGGRVAVDGAEVTLPVDERVAQGPRLGHADQGGVDDLVAVRVVVARGLSGDLRALHVARVGGHVEGAHRVEDAPLHGLEAVARVGKGAGDDDAHRVVDVGAA